MIVTALMVGVIGISYGATAVSGGFPLWFPVVLAMTVVAGSSEFVLIGILAAGGGVPAAVAAGLLLNLRILPYGMNVHDVIRPGWRRPGDSHLLNDETVAFALAETTPGARRAALHVSGLAILVCWPAGALAGAAAGSLIASPSALGLDTVFPAVIATLVIPRLTGRVRTAALTGAAITLIAGVALPSGLPILCSLAGLGILLIPDRRALPAPPGTDP